MKRCLAFLALAAAIGSAPVAMAQTAPTRAAAARGPAATTPADKAPAFDAYVRSDIKAALDAFQADGDSAVVQPRLRGLFERVIVHATGKQFDLFRDADFALRLAEQLAAVPADKRRPLLTYLRAHDLVARTLVFALREGDDAKLIYALFDRLRTARGPQMDTFANLAAAICVVHDRPLERNVNEVTLKSPDPLAIFDYYVANENRMAFGIRNVPPELLIYVVDTTASIDEMRWALAHYARDPNIGRHFFDIQYDRDYFESGKGKKLNSVPYNLPNILQVGGVCADQAYFAEAIGKAVGIPTAYAHGSSGETGHAWVGFLQAQGQRGAWNFDSGRYDEFKGVRGLVMDPHSHREIPDAFVSYTAELINSKPLDRQTAVALADAAVFLRNAEPNPASFAAQPLPDSVAPPQELRHPGIDAELALLKSALMQNPGSERAWTIVAALSAEGKLSLDQKKFWSDELLRQCGQRYPDFAVAVVSPMIKTVEDPKQQNDLWNGAFNRFQARFDLAAFIRMQQAELWESQKDMPKAGQCYVDVIDRYANAGPFILSALRAAEDDLPGNGKAQRAAVLFEHAWSKCQKPPNMGEQFARQSNWYRVGSLYAQRLATAGQGQRAQAVQAELNGAVGAPR